MTWNFEEFEPHPFVIRGWARKKFKAETSEPQHLSGWGSGPGKSLSTPRNPQNVRISLEASFTLCLFNNRLNVNNPF